MAASKALTKALRDPHLNEEEKIEAAIRCARHHHMGFESLARLRKDLLGEDASDLSIPEGNNRLEWIVRSMWQHERPKEVEKYDLLVEKKRVATRRKAGRRWRERKSQVDCSGACANLTWKTCVRE